MKNNTRQNDSYIQISTGTAVLDADIFIPKRATSLIVFAHGSGSNRHSTRNRYVSEVMNKAGLATLLVSILSVEEEAEDLIKGHLRFNIDLLGNRLVSIIDWLHDNPATSQFDFGVFGSSTGAAGALICAAERPEQVKAVVSRGGRPDMAIKFLDRVQAPTLLIVGGDDLPVIDLNRQALTALKTEKDLVIVPGATHLFEESGAIEQVAELARDWFVKYLTVKR